MNLTIVNISTSIDNQSFQSTVRAINKQVIYDFQPEWNISATIFGTSTDIGAKAPIDGNHDAIIYLGDLSQDPNTGVEIVLGYHFTNHSKVPYGFVYLDVCSMYNEEWSCTLSHEVLELLADPTAVLTVSGQAPGRVDTVFYDLEVCDPTQGDGYQIDGVTVCNFVGKSYFGLIGGSGKTNFLNLRLSRFGVRPHGYLQYEDTSGSHKIYGENVTDERKSAQILLGTARRNARRSERCSKTQTTKA